MVIRHLSFSQKPNVKPVNLQDDSNSNSAIKMKESDIGINEKRVSTRKTKEGSPIKKKYDFRSVVNKLIAQNREDSPEKGEKEEEEEFDIMKGDQTKSEKLTE